MSKRMKLGVGLMALALFGYIIFSTFQQTANEYEVCVTYKGRSHCATAAGQTPKEAISSAQQIGCSLITSGRDENMACLAAPLANVREIAKK